MAAIIGNCIGLLLLLVMVSLVVDKLKRWREEFARTTFRGEIETIHYLPVADPNPPSGLDELPWDEMEPEEDPRPARYREWPGR